MPMKQRWLPHRLHYRRMTLAPLPSRADAIIIVRTPMTTTSPPPDYDDAIAVNNNNNAIHYNSNYNNNNYNADTVIAMVSTVAPWGHSKEGSNTLAHFFTVWAVAVVLMTLAAVTLVANSTILTMFVLRKSVRRCKNIYIASLAAADLGIGLLVPVAALEQVESRWALQGTACHLYQTVRCSLLYVSLLSILLISVDRWWSIHYPFTYRVRQSKKLAAVAVAAVWLASFAVHVPPILLWDYVIGNSFGDDVTGGRHVSGSDASGASRQAGSAFLGAQEVFADTESSIPSVSLSSSSLSSSFSISASSPSPSPSAFLSMLTTLGPMTLPLERGETPLSDTAEQAGDSGVVQQRQLAVNDRGRCELPYNRHFGFVLTVSVVLYFFPLLVLWVLNCSLYFKITRRKSIKIRRSLSVNDHHLLTFRKSSSESESSPNGGANDSNDAAAVEIRSAEHRQRLLAAARAGRRHTLAIPGHLPRFGGGGAGSIYYPSQNISRYQAVRRVSLQDAFTGIGSVAALAGAVPAHLPRVTSCGRFTGGGGGGGGGVVGSVSAPGRWYGSGQRHSVCSSRKQSADLVKELLVRQDKKAARLLGLLVTVFTLCWLPCTVVAVLRARDPSAVSGWLRDVAFWVLLTNSAVNPFLYGLLNAEFRKILRGWFYFRRHSNYRLKHALLYWSLPPHGDSDALKDAQLALGRLATPIRE